MFALFVATSGFHGTLFFSTSLRKGCCSLEGSWCVAVICSTNERSPNVAIADFPAMPHSFSTTLQPVTPASSQQQRWSFQCHVYTERVLLHLTHVHAAEMASLELAVKRTVAPAGQSNALSLRKKVSKGDRLFIGGSRLYAIVSRCFTSLPPSTSIQTTEGGVWREGTEIARTNFALDAILMSRRQGFILFVL